MLALHTFASFLGAFLLFCVQPLAGRMLLPAFGGAASVWTTCMLFFQAVLLAGYGVAHALARRGPAAQLAFYATAMLATLLARPLSTAALADAPGASPVFAVLAALSSAVGPAALVVAWTAPLVQRWFARSPHAAAGDPYFLYAASNAGSLAALLAYPFAIEPWLSMAAQTRAWNGGLALLGVTMLGCGLLARGGARSSASALRAGASASSWPQRARWMFVSFVPASLLLGVTTHITTNIAAVPLLWVAPLALYLLTYILAYSRLRWVSHAVLARPLPYLLVLVAPLLFAQMRFAPWLAVAANLALVTLASLLVHRELARLRPGAEALTEYYLFVALGGVAAGLGGAILAPALFTSGLEYPLALALVPLAVGDGLGEGRRRDVLVAAGFGLGCAALVGGLLETGHLGGLVGNVLVFGVPAVICFGFKERPLRFALAYACFVVVLHLVPVLTAGEVLHIERNFYGVKQIVARDAGATHELFHGSIAHGLQHRLPETRRREATSYYAKDGPLGDVFALFESAGAEQRVMVVGLGVGTIAAYAHDRRSITFIEVDEAVERLARDPRFFSYLADCGPRCDVRIGDGRLELARASERFDAIVMDAFSADAVPVHLLTTQAAELYARRLTPDGLLVFHLSNRYVDLEPVVAGLAAHLGAVPLAKRDAARAYGVIARDDATVRALEARGWRRSTRAVTWTDEHSDILSVVRW